MGFKLVIRVIMILQYPFMLGLGEFLGDVFKSNILECVIQIIGIFICVVGWALLINLMNK